MLQHGGRLSRAAVFAGAAACYTSTPPPEQVGPPPPPPPDEHAQQAVEPPPPPPSDTDTAQGFAKPPPGKLARLRGVVRQGGRPLAGIAVQLHGASGGRSATTNAHGEYRFDDVEPGSYQITPSVATGHRFGPPQHQVGLAAGADERVDIDVPLPPPPDRGPCCKPYVV